MDNQAYDIIMNLTQERDRLVSALIAMVESYQYEASMENPILLKAKEVLERSGIYFDEDGNQIDG